MYDSTMTNTEALFWLIIFLGIAAAIILDDTRAGQWVRQKAAHILEKLGTLR